jgi:hypothetical protein
MGRREFGLGHSHTLTPRRQRNQNWLRLTSSACFRLRKGDPVLPPQHGAAFGGRRRILPQDQCVFLCPEA